MCLWANMLEIITHLNRANVFIQISSRKIYCHTIISQVSSLAYKLYHIATSHILANKMSRFKCHRPTYIREPGKIHFSHFKSVLGRVGMNFYLPALHFVIFLDFLD